MIEIENIPKIKLQTKNPNCNFRIVFEKAKVLIVDDIDINIMLIEGFLRNTGLEIFSGRNGKEAIEIVKNIKPDIILMDLRMPVLDGVKATEIIKQNIHTANIPIIALTATGIDIERIDGDIFDGFLTKPLTMMSLVRELSKFIKLKEL